MSPAVVGEADDGLSTMVEVSRACFDAILTAMKPGVTFGTLFDIYTRPWKGRAIFWSHPMMHARGSVTTGRR